NGTYAVTLSVTDKDGGTGSVSVSIAVSNVPPVIGSVTGPSAPVALGTPLSVVANFTDADAADTHTCSFTWDDGSTSAGTVSETNGGGSCTGTRTYAAAGVFSIT